MLLTHTKATHFTFLAAGDDYDPAFVSMQNTDELERRTVILGHNGLRTVINHIVPDTEERWLLGKGLPCVHWRH